MDKQIEPFSGKTTFIAFWASKGTTYNILQCCDLTHQRRPVATVEDMDVDYNRGLAEKICFLLNGKPSPTPPAEQIELLSCPFCGGANVHFREAVFSYGEQLSDDKVECYDCDAYVHTPDARIIWNTRATPTPSAGQIEVVAESELSLAFTKVFNDGVMAASARGEPKTYETYKQEFIQTRNDILAKFKASGAIFRNSAEYAEADDFWAAQDIGWEKLSDDVKNELRDYHFLLCNVPKVYCAVTGNTLSYPNYPHSVVIAEFERYQSQQIEEAIRDEASGAEQVRGLVDEIEQTIMTTQNMMNGMLQAGILPSELANYAIIITRLESAIKQLPEHMKARG